MTQKSKHPQTVDCKNPSNKVDYRLNKQKSKRPQNQVAPVDLEVDYYWTMTMENFTICLAEIQTNLGVIEQKLIRQNQECHNQGPNGTRRPLRLAYNRTIRAGTERRNTTSV